MIQASLDVYRIDMKYIRNLHNIDDRVLSVSPQIGKDERPFLGIIVICNECKYCIPLSKPKKKHERMKNKIDFKKIVDQASRVDEMYENENIDYDKAISYISMLDVLNGIGNSIDIYKHNISQNYESRNMYQRANEYQKNKEYHEAIQSYNKVVESDKKYYELAQKQKEQCIKLMYDYYIEKSKSANKDGNYEEALQYIDYLKEYYPNDDIISKLETEYKKNLSLYTLTSDDILNLILT